MKKIFSLLTLLSIFTVFLFTNEVKAQETCNATVVVHYHRFDEDYDKYELYAFDHGQNAGVIESTRTDDFGAIFEVPVCSNAKDNIGIVLKETGTGKKDGIDADNNGEIDDKLINVTDIRDTATTKHVYVMQGSAEAYVQDTSKATYFGKPNMGNVVIVYYNPAGNEGWDDLWTWGTGDKNEDILFDYSLGIDGGTDPNLFRVAVINVAGSSDEQIGFIARKNKSWDIKDDSWKTSLTENITDNNGHTYKVNGDRLTNVNGVRGGGFKFIFVINGIKDLYEDYDVFIEEAFKLEFTTTEFRTLKTLTITLNQAIIYDPETGPDVNKFSLKDKEGNNIPINKITYNSLVSSDKTFNIVLDKEIKQNEEYTIVYSYEQFGKQKQVQKQVTLAEELFDNAQDVDDPRNLTPYIISGIVVLAVIGVGAMLLIRRRNM